jgi:tungstate transport system substrate-binding protein
MLTLATTTSMRDTGLLNAILPGFQEQTGVDVKVIVVGSGQAIEMGRSGDVDVILTHSPDAEK